MAKALGAPCITSSSNTKAVARVAQVAARHALPVGMHNHSRIDPNEFATPQDFEQAMKVGPQIKVNLDIGHFTAANFDALDYVLRHHASILTLHIKDRKRDQGPAVPFGQGDTPIGAILRLLRDEKWAIPANIEYEYKGGNTIQEVTRCLGPAANSSTPSAWGDHERHGNTDHGTECALSVAFVALMVGVHLS